MRILHVSAECYPLAKAGGLADVVGALPKYQNNLGHQAIVMMPYYETKFIEKAILKSVGAGSVWLGPHEYSYSLLQIKEPNLDFEVILVKIDGLLDRPQIYSYGDDIERFIAFQKVVLQWLASSTSLPDIVHCHDHHTGLIPFMLSQSFNYKKLAAIPTVFSIHNAQYQGDFGYDKLHYLPDFDHNSSGLLDWNGSINSLATAIKTAWKVTTVSKTYLTELAQSAGGLESLLRNEAAKSHGILNGIDFEVWNPETDSMLVKQYSKETMENGKKANKKFLCEKFNLNLDLPLFVFIGRLVYEKGADLLSGIIYESLNRFRNKMNLLVLGSGDKRIENDLENLKGKFQGNYNTYIGYNEELSHIMYAGADFLLMPSRVEPCGLNQMYALRYGTIPIVRRTGGLKDTVIDLGETGGFGICHNQNTVWDATYSMARAVKLSADIAEMKSIQQRIMSIDHSWDHTASDYINLYQSIKNK
ncbi:glycogen synthase [Ascidiimonas sp. W6]|uniref:glycogen synthase n=1 Tax=Ascidiimonas meishanensis TaxID=3128903 RepID=UPI0030EE9F29